MEPIKFNKYQRQSKKKPLPIELPSGDVIVLPVPDGGTIMDAEEARTSSRVLELLCGKGEEGRERWRSLRPLLRALEDSEALTEFVKDVTNHFGMGADDAPESDGSR